MEIKPIHKNNSYIFVFFSILFYNIRSPQVKDFNIFKRCLLYGFAILFFYAPIIVSGIILCSNNYGYIPYFVALIIMHIISKFLFRYSKVVQHRFATAKEKRRFFIRIIMILEYIVLMWLVYLFYPIACILFPTAMIIVSYENLLGFSFFLDILKTHMEQFVFYGGISSYVIFLFIGGYKKMMTGLIPSYLRTYIILAALSGLITKAMNILDLNHIFSEIETFSSAISHVFSLSNQSLNIVSTFVMFAYATYSLYTTCGIEKSQGNGVDDN